MIIRNVKVYTEEKKFVDGDILIQDGVIVSIAESLAAATDDSEVLEGNGCYAIPGLIDLHFHGCMGYDFCDGTMEAVEEIARYEASIGVTAIAPATMTLTVEDLEHVLAVGAAYRKASNASADGVKPFQADLVGINMEGPFISPIKKGAQDDRNIIPCAADICERFLKASDGLVKFIGLAPEENGESLDLIRQMKDKVAFSLAHTNADYDTAKAAFDAGANHAVHLYNAMPPFTHRAPGVVGAVADSPHVYAEVICDGIHIHPAAVRATFRMLGEDRIILISDSMRATGMPDGEYTLGGLAVTVKDRQATLTSDGTLAGSVSTLMDCLRYAVKHMGIPLATAVACATVNPAKCLGIYDQYGSLTPGKKGNVVLLNQELALMTVIKEGTPLA